MIIDKSSKKNLEELLDLILQGFNKSSASGKNGPQQAARCMLQTPVLEDADEIKREKLALILKYSVMATASDRKQL